MINHDLACPRYGEVSNAYRCPICGKGSDEIANSFIKDVEAKVLDEINTCNGCKHHVITEADTVWEDCYCGLGNGGMVLIHINNCPSCTNDYKGCLDYEKRV